MDGAIHWKGGPAILSACEVLRASNLPNGLPTGHAVATTAGRLPAKWVIHTVGPVYHAVPNPAELLGTCHSEVLKVADGLGARVVAFPAISTGVYGYPLDEAADVAIAAVRRATTAVDEVRFVLFGAHAYRTFERALARAGD